MSFAKDVKIELCSNKYDNSCKKAFISAIIKINSILNISSNGISIHITFDNVSIIKTIYEILKELYHIETEIIVSKNMKLNKKSHYTLKIVNKAMDILDDLKLLKEMSFTNTINKIYYQNDLKKAYLAGAFVACGSVNAPSKANYHLEYQSSNKEYLLNLYKLIDSINKGKYPLHINFKLINRRKHYLLYIKSAQEIVDYLNYLQANNSTFKFEDIRMQRDFINSINRINNMDVANELKVQKASSKQIEHINLLIKANELNKLDYKIRSIAKLRLEYPEASLSELSSLYYEQYNERVSKSGMNHRFNKIKEIANKIK